MHRLLIACSLLLIACSDDGEGDPERDAAAQDSSVAPPVDGGPTIAIDAGLDARQPGTPRDAAPPGPDGALAREVPCVDEQIAKLILFEAPNPSVISEEGNKAGEFTSLIDAMAGGLMTSQSYVYARFTPSGLQKVAIGDEDAFYSKDWDIALRRYVVRLNSGVSGPGEVTGARTAPGTTFDGLSTPSSELVYHSEAYFTDSCELVPDTSGIGAPASVLSSFWSYSGCLSMTKNVFVVALASGRHVKLQVLSYYPPENQTRCDDTDMVNTPSGAGSYRIRWAFLD